MQVGLQTILMRALAVALGLAPLLAVQGPAVAAEAAVPPAGREVVITVDVDTELGEFYNFWNVFPVTVQAPFKDETRYDELRKLYPFANFINCVRFLGGIDLEKDDYFRGVGDDGRAKCDFTEAIALLSGIRKCGYTPWIVLDNVPAAMSKNPTKNKYGNTEPPADFKVWSSYVRQLVQALVGEFGLEEVGRWRFRVGTEPDLAPGHWSGTKEQYFAHYDYSVAAVRDILPDVAIGPGNILDPVKHKDRGWGLEIIDHCASGKNFATGKVGTPMDFFASSYYTAVGQPDDRFDVVINTISERLARHPRFAHVPVEVQEFGILTEGGKLLAGDGTEFGGSWAAHMAGKIYDLEVPRVYQWHWNTTKAGGLPIPVTHVLGMLEEMLGGRRLSAKASQENEADDVGCLACRKQDALDLIVFRHLAVRDDGEPIPVRVILEGKLLQGKDWTITGGSVIDREHSGFAHAQKADLEQARKEMGEDAEPIAVVMRVMGVNRAKYESMSRLDPLEPLPTIAKDDAGRIVLNLSMTGHSVVRLHFE